MEIIYILYTYIPTGIYILSPPQKGNRHMYCLRTENAWWDTCENGKNGCFWEGGPGLGTHGSEFLLSTVHIPCVKNCSPEVGVIFIMIKLQKVFYCIPDLCKEKMHKSH